MLNEEYEEAKARLNSLSDLVKEEAQKIHVYRMNFHNAYYKYEMMSIITNNSINSDNFKEFKKCQDEYEEAKMVKINAEIEYDNLRSLMRDLHSEIQRIEKMINVGFFN